MKKNCVVCGVEFEAKRSDKIYCSKKCYMWQYTRDHRVAKLTRACIGCGLEYQAVNAHQKYCTRQCANKYYAKDNKHIKRANYLRHRAHRTNNIDAYKEKEREYREKNKDKRKLAHKEWRNKNKSVVSQYGKNYRSRNQDKVNDYNREWRKNNRDKCCEYTKKYKSTHPDSDKLLFKYNCDNLNDSYVKRVIRQKNGIKSSEITQEMIDLKRTLILIYRTIKKQKNGKNKSSGESQQRNSVQDAI